MNILGTVLSYIYSNFNPFNYIPQNFNPVDTKFIKGNDVAYGLSFQDNNDGTSEVKLITSLLSKKNKSVTHNTGIRIPNALKGQLSLSLLKNPAGIDRVGIVFPENQRLSFNTYEVEHSSNASSINPLDSAKLQWHINNGNPANIGNSYSDPQAITLANGDVVVIAKNLKDETLASWYLKSDKEGKLKALAGEKGVTERKLLKLNNAGNQFVLNGNTLLSSQIDKKIVGNQAVKITDFFTSNMAGVFQSLKKGKGVNVCLLGEHCQINEKPFFSSEHEISFLQYVERGEGDIVAFLEKDKSSNKQKLSLIIFKDSTLLAYDTSIYEFEDSIEQLYVKDNGQGDVIVTAISREKIITFIKKSSEMPPKETTIPASSITSLSEFVHIVNGELTPEINTLPPTTVTEEAATSKKAQTASVVPVTAQTNTTTLNLFQN